MSSDVGASRIWNRLLDAAFDNSDRRKHGMGAIGRAIGGVRRSRGGRGGATAAAGGPSGGPGGFLRASAYSGGWRRATGGLSAADTSTDPRRRKLGGNAGDHRPYFTYWITAVQCMVLAAAMLAYGVGPVGVDVTKRTGMVGTIKVLLPFQLTIMYCVPCRRKVNNPFPRSKLTTVFSAKANVSV